MPQDPPRDESFAALFETANPKGTKVRRPRRGDRLDVKVVALGRDAVFVDLGGKQEGYFQRSELLRPDGTLSVDIGSTIQALVVEADGERVRLSPVFVRAPQVESEIPLGDGEVVTIPRARSGPLLVEGSHVRGTVTGVERYGVFVQIQGTHGRQGRGLVPTSETDTPRNADLRKAFPVGTEVEAKILAIAEDGKIRMSFKAMSADAERAQFEEYERDKQGEGDAPADGSKREPAASAHAPKPKPQKKEPPTPRSFGTLGDLLAKRKG